MELINDSVSEFEVLFKGPKESEFLYSQVPPSCSSYQLCDCALSSHTQPALDARGVSFQHLLIGPLPSSSLTL